jgi:hypothetical protein
MSTASASDSPTICSLTPMTAKSPLAQVACWRCLIAAKSGAAAVGVCGCEGARAAMAVMFFSLKSWWRRKFLLSTAPIIRFARA